MEPNGAEPETIAGGDDPDRPTFNASRSLIVATAWGLAGCLLVSAGLAVHYHQQLTDVRKRVSSVAAAGSLPSTAPAAASLTPIVVESPQQQPVPASSAPASDAPVPPLTEVTSSTTQTIGPPFSSVGYQLNTGALRTTVYLTSAAYRGVGSTEGQLLVSALIDGATAGASYRLVGGSCNDPETDIVWAQGVADSAGSAYLVGALRTLGTGTQYYLTLDPAPTGTHAGLEGVFALGQGVAFVGQLINDQGVSGGQCAIGP